MSTSLIVENLPGMPKMVVPFPLSDETVHIGRSDMNAVIIDDESVSRCHSKISLVDGLYVIEDLGSKVGTVVNDKKVTSRILENGDLIAIGPTRLRFVRADDMSAKMREAIFARSGHSGGVGNRKGWITIPTSYLDRLAELSRWFGAIGDNFSLLDNFAESLLGMFRCDRAQVVLFEENRAKPLLRIVRSVPQASVEQLPEQDNDRLLSWILKECIRADRTVNVDAAKGVPALQAGQGMSTHMLAVPCNTYHRSMGFVLLERRKSEKRFGSVEAALATVVVAQLTLYLRYTL